MISDMLRDILMVPIDVVKATFSMAASVVVAVWNGVTTIVQDGIR